MAKQKTPQSKKPVTKTGEDTETETETEETEESDEDTAEAENRRINAIVTSRVKREMKGVLAQLTALGEQITKLAPAKKDPDEETSEESEETEGTPKKDQLVDPKLSKKMDRMAKELADEKAARKKAEMERAEELERSKKSEMRGAYQSVLTELGLTSPRLLRAALDQLEQDGVMIRDESGKIKFKGVDKYGIEQEFDPKAGLKAWVTTEGKEFMPAVDASGSGTGGAQGIGNSKFTSKDVKGMDPKQLASINLERACSGLPPLGEVQ